MIKKVVLMGNPNTGKSVVFSRLTGAYVISSNYPGTTVDFSKGKMRINGETVEIIDAPGTYSLEPSNKAEEVASHLLKDADVVIDVVDSTNLERNLFLTLELLEKKVPLVIALNLWDEAKHLGIHIDHKKLERILGVPVIPTVALTGEGIKELVSNIKNATVSNKFKVKKGIDKWTQIGEIIKEVERVEHRHHKFRDRIEDLTLKPITGIPFAILVLLSAFLIVRLIGENISNFINSIFENFYLPLIEKLSNIIGPGFLHTILIGEFGKEINFMESLGIITTGIYIPFAVVLPYIVAFYFTLSLLEDSGYLPRLATLVDTIFHRFGIHGNGIISLFLGLGCNVPGALATRILETRKQRFIAATLLSISIPCTAQTAMIFGMLGKFGLQYIVIVFLTLGILYVVLGLILNKIIKGESPEIFLEIPPYRKPSLRAVCKKTWMRIKWFLREALPFLFLGILVINFLYLVGLLQWLGKILQPLMYSLFGLPGETSVAIITGFLRKDLAVGMLLAIEGMNALQLTIAATILTIYFPCAATFSVLLRELGLKDMLKSATIMIITVLIVGIIMKLVLLGV